MRVTFKISHLGAQYQLPVFSSLCFALCNKMVASTVSQFMMNYYSMKHSQARKHDINLNYEVTQGTIVLQQRSYHLFQFGGTSFGRHVAPLMQERPDVGLRVFVPSRSV